MVFTSHICIVVHVLRQVDQEEKWLIYVCDISPIPLNDSLNTNPAIPGLTLIAPITTIQCHYYSSELYEKTQHCIATVTHINGILLGWLTHLH